LLFLDAFNDYVWSWFTMDCCCLMLFSVSGYFGGSCFSIPSIHRVLIFIRDVLAYQVPHILFRALLINIIPIQLLFSCFSSCFLIFALSITLDYIDIGVVLIVIYLILINYFILNDEELLIFLIQREHLDDCLFLRLRQASMVSFPCI
jgi:hypothetical protein